MSNVFKIKRGSNPPNGNILEEGELGFDNLNNNLYIGIKTDDGNDVYNINTHAINADEATHATNADNADNATNAVKADNAENDNNGDEISITYLKKLGMLDSSVTSVTSGTNAGTQSTLRIYGQTYGNDSTYITVEGQLSYGDPGPQIQFGNSSQSQNIALIFTDHNTIGGGASISLVSDQSNAYFIAPYIKALKEFSGDLNGNAESATKLTTSAGSTTQPVYFSNGVPVTIGSDVWTKANIIIGSTAPASKTDVPDGALYIYVPDLS